MSKMNKIVFIDKTKSAKCGLFCPVCSFMLKTSEDNTTFKKWNSCHDCYLRFIEGRKDEWKKGWRPSKDTIDALYEEKARLFIK